MRKYQVIYADPGWPANVNSPPYPHEDGQPVDAIERGFESIRSKYTTMTMTQLRALPVIDLADSNCTLFLWVLSPILEKAIDLATNHWHFKYRGIAFNWIKITNRGNLRNNLGPVTMPGSELCLLFTVGKHMNQTLDMWTGTKQVQMTEHPDPAHAMLTTEMPRDLITLDCPFMHEVLGHSIKPPCVRDSIVHMTPGRARIELFSRMSQSNEFDVWGNEAEGSIDWWPPA